MAEQAQGVPAFEPDSVSQQDELAQAEAIKIGNGDDLESDGKRQEHGRHQKFRNHVNAAMLGLFWLLVALVGAGTIVFVWHLLTPASWHWLEEDSLAKLQTLLGSALLSSALTGYVNKRIAA